MAVKKAQVAERPTEAARALTAAVSLAKAVQGKDIGKRAENALAKLQANLDTVQAA